MRMYIVLAASSRLYSSWRQVITEDYDDDDDFFAYASFRKLVIPILAANLQYGRLLGW